MCRLANELVEAVDILSTEAAVSTMSRFQGNLNLANFFPTLPGSGSPRPSPSPSSPMQLSSSNVKSSTRQPGGQENGNGKQAKESTTIVTARKLALTLTQSSDVDAERVFALVRRIAREPKAQTVGLDIMENLSERLVSKSVKLLFQLPLDEDSQNNVNQARGK